MANEDMQKLNAAIDILNKTRTELEETYEQGTASLETQVKTHISALETTYNTHESALSGKLNGPTIDFEALADEQSERVRAGGAEAQSGLESSSSQVLESVRQAASQELAQLQSDVEGLQGELETRSNTYESQIEEVGQTQLTALREAAGEGEQCHRSGLRRNRASSHRG